jgi:hypothetical protein
MDDAEDMTSRKDRIAVHQEIPYVCCHIHMNAANPDCPVVACPCQLHRDAQVSAMDQYSAGLIHMQALDRILRREA